VKFYYQKTVRQEYRDLRLETMAMTAAINAALMGDKDGKFQGFLDMLQGDIPTEDLHTALDKAKKDGLPIEEG
jgi:hypothetical protein